jgi:two-component system NtrC family sensor kinase
MESSVGRFTGAADSLPCPYFPYLLFPCYYPTHMPPQRSERILVVDDDPVVLELVATQILAPQGYQVETAQDGAAGLQAALRQVPDILLTSLDLPGLSGRDLITAVRSQGLETTVIATGPRGAEAQALQAFRLGAKDYLGKPLRETELVASFDRALSEVRLRRERESLAQRLAAANQQLEKRVKELTTLAGIGKAVTAVTSLSHLFTRLLEAGLYVTEADVGWLMLAEEGDASKPLLRAGKNLPNLSTIRMNQPWDDGLTSLLMVSGEGLTLAGPPLAKLRAGQVVKAAVAVPLKARDRVLGVIVAGNKIGRPFTERDQAMLTAVADYAVIAIVNARLFQALEARAQSLQQSLDSQVSENNRRLDQAARLAHQLRSLVHQARAPLEPLVASPPAGLSRLQAESVFDALDRLAALERLLDELAPAPAVP